MNNIEILVCENVLETLLSRVSSFWHTQRAECENQLANYV